MLFSLVAQTQNAVVKRNTRIFREGPSSSNKKIVLLKSGDELELIEREATENYYHVRTSDGEEGYAYFANVTVEESPEKIRTELAAPSGKPDEKIANDWEKAVTEENDVPWTRRRLPVERGQ